MPGERQFIAPATEKRRQVPIQAGVLQGIARERVQFIMTIRESDHSVAGTRLTTRLVVVAILAALVTGCSGGGSSLLPGEAPAAPSAAAVTTSSGGAANIINSGNVSAVLVDAGFGSTSVVEDLVTLTVVWQSPPGAAVAGGG